MITPQNILRHELTGLDVSAADLSRGPREAAPDHLIILDMNRDNPTALAGRNAQDMAQ